MYTHAHFDHCFGTTAFLPCGVWAHKGCLTELRARSAGSRSRRAEWYRGQGRPDIAEALACTTIELPNRLVTSETELDLGGRRVVLSHVSAHTDHDLLVHVPDASVVFAGDVVENAQGGFSAESFGADSQLAKWPAALAAIEALDAHLIVPGHGDPVSRAFVAEQRRKLTQLIALHNRVHAGELSEKDALARSPYTGDVTLAAFTVHSVAGDAITGSAHG